MSAILDQLFLGTDNTYSINDRQITIYHKGEQPNSQQQSNKFTVTGVITDAQGESMIGVSVKSKRNNIREESQIWMDDIPLVSLTKMIFL